MENWGRDKQWVVVQPGEPVGGRGGAGTAGSGSDEGSTSHQLIGSRVAKDFGADGIFYGRVIGYHPPGRDKHGALKPELFSIVYTDGDEEDFDLEELKHAMQFAQANIFWCFDRWEILISMLSQIAWGNSVQKAKLRG